MTNGGRDTRSMTTTKQRGFTLMEVVVTMGLMAIVFSLVFFKIDTLVPSSRIKTASRELASRLEEARNFAIVKGLPIQFQYDIEQGRFRYFVPFELAEDGKTIQGEGETVIFDWEILPDTIVFKDLILGEGDPIDHGIVTVIFEPRGVATGHIVHINKTDSDVIYSIVVAPILGIVDVNAGELHPEVAGDSVF